MSTEIPRPQTFAEFWDYYVSQHMNRANRRTHFIGTSIGALLLVPTVLLPQPWLILLAIAVGYAFAWFGHFVFEKNKPATWGSPLFALWSFGSDWIMWSKMLTGRMNREVLRVGQRMESSSHSVAQPAA